MEDPQWSNEYNRATYLPEDPEWVPVRVASKEKTRLIMQPHTLSRCAEEAWRTPEEAEIVGRWWGHLFGGTVDFFVPQQFQKSAFRLEQKSSLRDLGVGRNPTLGN